MFIFFQYRHCNFLEINIYILCIFFSDSGYMFRTKPSSRHICTNGQMELTSRGSNSCLTGCSILKTRRKFTPLSVITHQMLQRLEPRKKIFSQKKIFRQISSRLSFFIMYRKKPPAFRSLCTLLTKF